MTLPEVHPGDRFGYLTVLRPAGPGERGGKRWLCACNCGKLIAKEQGALRGRAGTLHCGCGGVGKRFRPEVHPGDRFGHLTVESEMRQRGPRGGRRFLCRCQCGARCVRSFAQLTQPQRRNDTHCGCQGRPWLWKEGD